MLATALVAAHADAAGFRYFQDLSERNPADATALALAGFFAVRAGHDVAAAITTLDKAAAMEPGLPQYFRGLALADLHPSARKLPLVPGNEGAGIVIEDPSGRFSAGERCCSSLAPAASLKTAPSPRSPRSRAGTSRRCPARFPMRSPAACRWPT